MKSILARLRTWFGQQPLRPAANTTNEAAPGKPRKRPPGAADLQLHSRDAQQLLAGRRGGRGRIVGLYAFAKEVRELERVARQGNRRARAVLDSIAAEIADIEDILVEAQTLLRDDLERTTRISFDPYRDGTAQPLQFTFRSAYAWQALQLIARYDDILCLAIPYYRAGLLDKARYRECAQLGTHLRRLLGMAEKGAPHHRKGMPAHADEQTLMQSQS